MGAGGRPTEHGEGEEATVIPVESEAVVGLLLKRAAAEEEEDQPTKRIQVPLAGRGEDLPRALPVQQIGRAHV